MRTSIFSQVYLNPFGFCYVVLMAGSRVLIKALVLLVCPQMVIKVLRFLASTISHNVVEIMISNFVSLLVTRYVGMSNGMRLRFIKIFAMCVEVVLDVHISRIRFE